MPEHPEKSPQAISIRRHCMQNILHAVLINEHDGCSGLLANAGNVVETQLNVTKNMLFGEHDIIDFIKQQQVELADRKLGICGIYHSTYVNQACISLLSKLYRSALGRRPECYLLLDPKHPGRIDALLYHDSACMRGIVLNMVEDAAG